MSDQGPDPVIEPVIDVVGIGVDGPAGLTGAARGALARARVVLGGPRQLALLDLGGDPGGDPGGGPGGLVTGARRVPLPRPLLPGLWPLLDQLAGQPVCALASGDPMFYGLGATLCRELGRARVRVHPHPSSVSLACARLGWAVQDVTVLSVVGRPLERLNRWLAPGRRVLVLVPDASGPARVAGLLTERGWGPSELTVLAGLGGPGERVDTGRAGTWSVTPGDALAVVGVHCVPGPGTATPARVPGLPDEAFEHDGQLTKREIRAVTLARLAPLPGRLLWDVGAGSGSVSVEWLRAEESARAVAVERDPVRAARIGRNAAALGTPELRVVLGAAPAALDGLEPPDAVFVGGGVSAPGVLERCWGALRPGGRLVANAVTVEAEGLLGGWYTRHGGSLTRLQVQRAAPVGGFTGWRPAMPVTQWVADKP